MGTTVDARCVKLPPELLVLGRAAATAHQQSEALKGLRYTSPTFLPSSRRIDSSTVKAALVHPHVGLVIIAFLDLHAHKVYRSVSYPMSRAITCFYEDHCYEYLYNLLKFGPSSLLPIAATTSSGQKGSSASDEGEKPYHLLPSSALSVATAVQFFALIGFANGAHIHMLQQLEWTLNQQVTTAYPFLPINLTTTAAAPDSSSQSLLAIVVPEKVKVHLISRRLDVSLTQFCDTKRQPLLAITSSGWHFESKTNVTLMVPKGMTALPNNLLSHARCPSVSFRGAEQLISIGQFFCYESAVDSVDTTSWHNVTRLGRMFCASAYNIKKLDLSPLVSLKQIGNGFCARSALTHLNLENLSEVDCVRNWFCHQCRVKAIAMSTGFNGATSVTLQKSVKSFHDAGAQEEARREQRKL